MRIPVVFSFAAFFLCLMLPQVFSASEHDWTGFVFKGGIETNPEKGGPFRSSEACFSWGKSKVWRASDKYMCGIDCRKDAVGRNYCKSIDTESTAVASVARIDAEEEAAAKKKAEAENPGAPPETKKESVVKAPPTQKKSLAEKAKSVYSSTVRVS